MMHLVHVSSVMIVHTLLLVNGPDLRRQFKCSENRSRGKNLLILLGLGWLLWCELQA